MLNFTKAFALNSVRRLKCNRLSHSLEVSRQRWNEYLYMNDNCDEVLRQTFIKDLTVIEDFLSNDEENSLLQELDPCMKKLRYEYDHWDDAIHKYRETERLNWNESNTLILTRVRNIAFSPGTLQLQRVHVLDLAEEGYVKPHIDSIRSCGNTIAGLSLLTDCVMRFVHQEQKEICVDVLLKKKSLYIMKDFARYNFTHEILPNDCSRFRDEVIHKGRRLSIICRNEPSRDTVNTALVNCPYITLTHQQLSQHVLHNHSELILEGSSITEMSFGSMKEFKAWKSKEGKDTHYNYILASPPRHCKRTSTTVSTYFFHHSGLVKRRGKGIWHMKIQGSCKINTKCPAMLTVHNGVSNVRVFTMYILDTAERSGISCCQKEEREQIAGRLAQNVPFDTVLKNIRDNLDSKQITRLHLLQRHDLNNIAYDFRLDSDKQSDNDVESVCIWIDRFKKKVMIVFVLVSFKGFPTQNMDGLGMILY